MEITTIRYEYALLKEEEAKKIPETMWYQNETDKQNFEFLNIGQLTPLKRYHNTIISVKHYIAKCGYLYSNSNPDFAEKIKEKERKIIAKIKESYESKCAGKGSRNFNNYKVTDDFKKELKYKMENELYNAFKHIYNTDDSLRSNLMHLYCDRIEDAINKGLPLEQQRSIRFEYLPASLGYDVDCYKIVAERI